MLRSFFVSNLIKNLVSLFFCYIPVLILHIFIHFALFRCFLILSNNLANLSYLTILIFCIRFTFCLFLFLFGYFPFPIPDFGCFFEATFSFGLKILFAYLMMYICFRNLLNYLLCILILNLVLLGLFWFVLYIFYFNFFYFLFLFRFLIFVLIALNFPYLIALFFLLILYFFITHITCHQVLLRIKLFDFYNFHFLVNVNDLII
jgi:hypothetical protein